MESKPDKISLRREAVLFDLDGVIVSSELQKSQAHIQTVLQLGGTPSQALNELYGKIIGLSHERTRDRFLSCAGVPITSEVKQIYRGIYKAIYRGMLEQVNLYPGVRKLLEHLFSQQIRIGLVSSAHPDEIATILKKTQVHHFFTMIISSEDVKKHKPSPEPYLKALDKLGLSTNLDAAVVFEDTFAGITAAQAAGLRVFAVRHSLNYNQNLGGAERIFESLDSDSVLEVIETYLGI